jgi:hypothetical protein
VGRPRIRCAAPLDEGGAWDFELQAVQEVATALDVGFDAQAGRLQLQPLESAQPRTTFTLTLTGTAPFCEAFRAAFDIA